MFLFPGREFFALAAAVRDNQSGALIAAVCDGHRLTDGGLGAGFFPASGVVPVARQRLTPMTRTGPDPVL